MKFYDTVFDFDLKSSDLAIIALEGAKEMAQKIDDHLVKWFNKANGINTKYKKINSFIVDSSCPRFTTGDAKGIVNQTIRAKDVFIISDVGNYSVEYDMFGRKNMMSPDDHYQDLKRIISAMAGKPRRITLIMPLLYGGRQHRRSSRESLDCSQMLHEMEAMGITGIITFDAHDPRVQNSVPLMGFDNFLPTYQILKALLRSFPNVSINKDNFMIVSPDEGAMSRNIYYASVLGLDLGMFYKRRDYTIIENGRNPIVAHEYIGNSVKGKSVFVADDIIATGDSMLKLCQELKEQGAKQIFISATYGLFTEGTSRFDEAYKLGLFDAVICTNLTYVSPILASKEWYKGAEMSKFLAYILAACHQDISLSSLLDPMDKINLLINKYDIKTNLSNDL